MRQAGLGGCSWGEKYARMMVLGCIQPEVDGMEVDRLNLLISELSIRVVIR